MPKIIGAPSQYLVPISEIKEGVVILKSGGVRAVLLASSINFALKSNEEQEAIIIRFQEFLNSLDFSLQIVVQSRKLNIEPYLKQIKDLEQAQDNELLRLQTAEYHDFVKDLVFSANIMAKTFYVIVPYSAGEEAQKKGIMNIIKQVGGSGKTQIEQQRFHQIKAQLWQRVDHVAASLGAMSVRALPLNTEELVELFYELYNPGKEGEKNLSAPQDMGFQE